MYIRKWRKNRGRKDAVRAVCTLCAQEICAGERMWCYNGMSVCPDCFLPFAREVLRSFEVIPGEEREE